MARTDITVTDVPASYPGSLDAITFEAADIVNQNQVRLTGREIVLIRNDDASPQTVTITSKADPNYQRTGDITESVPAGETHVSPLFKLPGWVQTDGYLYFEAPDADVKFAVLRIP